MEERGITSNKDGVTRHVARVKEYDLFYACVCFFTDIERVERERERKRERWKKLVELLKVSSGCVSIVATSTLKEKRKGLTSRVSVL